MNELTSPTANWTLVRAHWRHDDPPNPSPHRVAVIVLSFTAVICALLYWHGATFVNDPDEHFGERELGTFLSVALLCTCAVGCGRIRRSIRPARFTLFWTVAMIGYALLAIDDLVRIHERLDEWIHLLLQRDPEDPLTDHIDDAIVAVYPLLALALAWTFRFQLLAMKWLVLYMTLAAAMFAAMVGFDVAGTAQWAEESFKILSVACMVVAIDAARRNPQLYDIARASGRPPWRITTRQKQ